MRMFGVIAGLAVSASLALGQAAPEKRRVAIIDFNYATVMSSVQQIFGSNQDIGKGISDLLVNKLVNDGTYRVIERAALDKILKEQNFSNSDRADATTAAKIGRVLGVDTIITGDITQFGRDDKNTNVGGFGNKLGGYGIGGVSSHKSKAVVEITARMIDVNTAEILASVTGHGESERSGTNLLGGGGSGWNSGGGNLDMSSSNFGATIIGEAVKTAVNDVGTKLDQDSAKIPHTTVQVNGLVADATGNSIIINVGSRAGVKVGDRLMVTRVNRVIKDPATGKPLRTIEDPVGEMQVTAVDETSATGTFTGSGQPKVGDTVKNP